jgi:hypothetical protein
MQAHRRSRHPPVAAVAAVILLLASAMAGNAAAQTDTPPVAPDDRPTFALHLGLDAAGGSAGSPIGMVGSSLSDDVCPSTCDARVPAGQVIVLEAQAFQSFAFKGWSRPKRCSEFPNVHERCTLTMPAADLAMLAVFVRTGGTIRVSSSGDSSITSDPDGLRCGKDPSIPQLCSADFAIGTRVTLHLAVGSGSRVIGWGLWQCPRARRSCSFTVDGDLDATARVSPVTLVVRRFDLAEAGGAIATRPAGLTCGVGCSSEQARFPYGSTVHLFPSAGAASFGGWNGPCVATTVAPPDCAVALFQDTSVLASFGVPPALFFTSGGQRLSVRIAGAGKGKVRVAPADRQASVCAHRCTVRDLRFRQKVVLKAMPRSGSRLRHWSGGLCPGHLTCRVSAGIVESARAVFRRR